MFVVSLGLVREFAAIPGMQMTVHKDWLPSLGISYHLGIDGISLLLVLLTSLLTFVATLSSWRAVSERLKEYYAFFLVLQTAMLGVFTSLDFLLFSEPRTYGTIQ